MKKAEQVPVAAQPLTPVDARLPFALPNSGVRPTQRFPTWAIIVATTVALFGGLAIAAQLVPDAHGHQLPLVSQPSLGRLFVIGVPAYLMEALVFTVGAIELAAKFARRPLLGAAAGIFGYGVLYHWSHGLSGIILASWIALVLNASYIVLRARSKQTAILSTVGQKLTILMFAALVLCTLKA